VPSYHGAPMAKKNRRTEKTFNSDLGSGTERFLSATLMRAFEEGFRTPDDFMRNFTPLRLMEGLAASEDLRFKVLVEAAGVHERIARKKSTATAAEDLQLALDEGMTTPAAVLELIPPDDRVRFLDRKIVWKFVIEDEFWKRNNSEAIARVVFLLETALDQGILSLQDVADGLTFHEIAACLPEEDLRTLVEHALTGSRTGRPLDEQTLLEIVPLEKLVEYVPLEHVWERVVIDKVARPAGFVGASSDEPAVSEAPDSPVARSVPPPLPTKKSSGAHAAIVTTDVPLREHGIEVVEERGGVRFDAARPMHEEQARRRVVDRLKTIDRLPPSHEMLSLPILLSIESMYAELLGLSNDEQREACIRESFPNEGHLRSAMLALIELLDPTINTRDEVISEGDIDSLIKVVLFEERRRFEDGRNAMRQPALSPQVAVRRAAVGPPPMRKASVPAPAQRSSSPPPSLDLEVEVVDDDLMARR
jgi:hypothetical protein